MNVLSFILLTGALATFQVTNYKEQLLARMNQIRRDNGVPEVQMSDQLNSSAQEHADYQLSMQQVVRTGDRSPLERVTKVGFKALTAAAAVAKTNDTSYPKAIDAMMDQKADPLNLEAIRGSKYTQVGFGVAVKEQNVYWAFHFAEKQPDPQPSSVAPSSTPPSSTSSTSSPSTSASPLTSPSSQPITHPPATPASAPTPSSTPNIPVVNADATPSSKPTPPQLSTTSSAPATTPTVANPSPCPKAPECGCGCGCNKPAGPDGGIVVAMVAEKLRAPVQDKLVLISNSPNLLEPKKIIEVPVAPPPPPKQPDVIGIMDHPTGSKLPREDIYAMPAGYPNIPSQPPIGYDAKGNAVYL